MTTAPGGVDDCWVTLLLLPRALLALVTVVLVVPLPYMAYAILPENPWQLPVLLNRSSLDGGATRSAGYWWKN